jgi:hypothetical protein
MEWLKIIKKPEQIDLSNSPISERIEAPLHIRLIRHRDIKKNADRFSEFMLKNRDNLIPSWHNYIKEVENISYNIYCKNFFNKTLKGVDPKSLKFKNN